MLVKGATERREAIDWNNSDLLPSGTLGINLSDMGIKIQDILFTIMYLNMSSVKWWPFCPEGDNLVGQ